VHRESNAIGEEISEMLCRDLYLAIGERMGVRGFCLALNVSSINNMRYQQWQQKNQRHEGQSCY